jgi:hypothetical protein
VLNAAAKESVAVMQFLRFPVDIEETHAHLVFRLTAYQLTTFYFQGCLYIQTFIVMETHFLFPRQIFWYKRLFR